jgi:hypothetical protein
VGHQSQLHQAFTEPAWTSNPLLNIEKAIALKKLRREVRLIESISKIKDNYNKFEENLADFSKNFVPNGAENTAKIVAQIIEEKK